jgi:hypothetical protein
LKDLSTTGNVLSVWEIHDDRTNLNRVVGAMAVTGDGIVNFDYALLDWRTVEESGFQIEKCDGDTPDVLANTSWHYDIVRLSGMELVRLAKIVSDSPPTVIDRVNPPKLKDIIVSNVKSGAIDLNNIKKASMQQEIRAAMN